MIALFDVDYREDKAHAAAVIIENWQSEDPFRIYTKIIDNIEAYQPGEFYKRELPCLVSLISLFEEKISVLVVDSYVWVKSKKGLGGYLYDHFQGKYPVVGVAKSRFADCGSVGFPDCGSCFPLLPHHQASLIHHRVRTCS